MIGIADLDTTPLAVCQDRTDVDLFGPETGCNHPFFVFYAVTLLIVLWSTVILIVLFR